MTKLLVDVVTACAEYQDKALRNLPCKLAQCDEICSFCYAKQKYVPKELKGVPGYGDLYTWTALCADTEIAPCWHVGPRDAVAAKAVIAVLSERLANRVQLTTDGYRIYINAVEAAFAGGVDYAMLVKLHGESGGNSTKRKYSSGECCGAIKGVVCGNPDDKHVSTSFVERQNLTMRLSMRRFTRLTNAFSKKAENHMHAVSLHFMYYNFGRIHKSLRVTPAMVAAVSDHIWTLEEIAGLVKDEPAKKRGPFKKKNSK